VTAESARDLAPEAMLEKIGWARTAAAAAGRPAEAIELQVNVYLCEIGGSAARPSGSAWAALLAADPGLVRAFSPAVLVGRGGLCRPARGAA
jgi:hypothetical protein